MNFEGNYSRDISLKFRRNFLFIFKELLNNIEKHAQASRVDISLSITKHKLILTVVDDGIGFDAENPETDGIGIKNLKRRTKKINATVEIDSVLGQGTKVTLTVPIT